MSSIGGIIRQGAGCVHAVRTISSGYRWLRVRYVLNTGDTGVLDEFVHFIEGRPVNADEDSYYDLPDGLSKRPVCTITVCGLS